MNENDTAEEHGINPSLKNGNQLNNIQYPSQENETGDLNLGNSSSPLNNEI